MNDQVIIVGVAGGSGSGKTTFAKTLCERFGPESSFVLYQDNYYKDQSAKFDFDGGSVNFDHPDAIDFSLLAEHLTELKKQKPIQIPIYDFPTHTRKEKKIDQKPKPIVIVDGILILSQPKVRELMDVKVFVDCPEGIRFQRRLKRDVEERGRTPQGVKNQFDLQVKPMHDEYVQPSSGQADLVASGTCEDYFLSYINELYSQISEKISFS
ncbi:MAG: uridine kinase [Halobacteriovoraceae bacterium]|nr:uridine kinase [Halobacteriovoraceae bacterium]|tara:strand:+ start:25903 stop:26535 length:633 start_codon:yes stop_codon:yes gene_type:complete